MATEPVFFGVVRVYGRDQPRLFFDIVPPSLTGRGSPLIYCTRLDTLPGGADLVTWSLDALFRAYQRLKAHGKLPPEDRGIKPTGGGGATKIATGERYRYLSGWDRDAPAYPPLDDPAWLAGVGAKKNPPAGDAGGQEIGGSRRGVPPLPENFSRR